MIISKITVNLRLNQQLKYIIAKNCVLPFKKWVYLNHEGRFGFNSGSRTKSNSKGKLYLLILPRGVYILCLLENNGEIAARVIIYKRPLVCRPQIQSTATFDSDPVINIW